jgi:hypothetical protein
MTLNIYPDRQGAIGKESEDSDRKKLLNPRRAGEPASFTDLM